MKNILNISVIAALAILPMAANATRVAGDPTHSDAASGLTTDAQPKWALAEANESVDGNVATAGYVKGAYNAAMKAINTIADTAGNALTASSTATLTNKSIDANGTGNSITNLETDNFATGVIVTEVGATGADTALPTEQAVREAITTATNGMVTLNDTQTVTNKTIDADDNTISNLETDNFKAGTVVDSTANDGAGIAAFTNASDTKLVTEKAVAQAINGLSGDYATKTGAAATAAAAVNGATIDFSQIQATTGTLTGSIQVVDTWGATTPAANPVSVTLSQDTVVTGVTGNVAGVANKISAGTVAYTPGI